MCKVIARRPRMHMLHARSWQQLFSEPEQRILSLAEVVQRHQTVVLLGDPGSGKTTLGRWLVLQYTGALQREEERVTVRADHVRPGAEDTLIELDCARLPIPVRIADYARTRWGKEPSPDLSLERFVERGLYHRAESLPAGMTPTQVGALAQAALEQGQALVVLDGLDEVGDLRQRQSVMHAIQDAIQSWRAQHPDGNRVVLTSRIVGYQFHPLTHLPHYTVEDMDDTAITAFCHAWMRHVAETDPDATDAQAQQLATAIIEQAQPGVRVLAGNPLLLTILAQVYWQSSERALPTRRVDLFDAAANALYDQRERFWDNAGIPRLRLYRALAAVAAYLHADEVTGFAEEGSIRAQLATVLPDSEQVEAVLAAAREVSGFLVERGSNVYGFPGRPGAVGWHETCRLGSLPAVPRQRCGDAL
jgi:predicted NACHT family NTPase